MKPSDPLMLTARCTLASIGLRFDRYVITFKVGIPLLNKNLDDQSMGALVVAESSEDVRGFVRGIAKWLGVPVPRARGVDVTLSYNWFVGKLTLHGGDGTHAEIYLNLLAGGKRPVHAFGELFVARDITLAEKDEAYRADVVRLLNEALIASFG